jgi:hypothetical protein
MNLGLFVLTALMTVPAFAYGTRVSTGNGFTCDLSVNVTTVNRGHCNVHVISETKPEPLLRDVNGQRYTTVTQVIDNADCFETQASATYLPLEGDLSAPLSGALSAPQNLSLSTSPKYNNDSGTIDLETRHGVRYYINKDVAPVAAAADQARLKDALAASYRAVTVSYDSLAKTLTFDVVGLEGRRTFVRTADFSAGRTGHQAGFSASVSENLSFGTPARATQVSLSCSPLSVRK